ncbi:uncharacterized protein LOC110448001 isoform X2 [Mizuhopecten yessoensis]|uniref:uncharacterized protein LOC110448001 isoform X2 n=1 Tax=Mizuhopecten yessoensis TaxID=6573 RepID=UPI000B45F20A|nr:uncharacterized protein LOC110448001 isoform X2 [Mizuhopecten yessoensis]
MIRVQTCQRSLQGYLLLGIEELTLLTADKNWSHFNNHDDFPVLFNLPSSWSRSWNVPPPCNIVVDCTNKPDFKFADLETSCRSYYTCHNGYFYGHNFCSPGLVFDESMQICNWPFNVVTPCGTIDNNYLVG